MSIEDDDQKLKEIGHQFVEAFTGRRYEDIVSLLVANKDETPVFHFYGPSEFPLFRSWKGSGGLREMLDLVDLLMESNFELQDYYVEDSNSRTGQPSPYRHIIIRLREFGRMKNTSKQYDSITIFVLDVTTEGRIAHVHEYSNTYSLCRAYIK